MPLSLSLVSLSPKVYVEILCMYDVIWEALDSFQNQNTDNYKVRRVDSVAVTSVECISVKTKTVKG